MGTPTEPGGSIKENNNHVPLWSYLVKQNKPVFTCFRKQIVKLDYNEHCKTTVHFGSL